MSNLFLLLGAFGCYWVLLGASMVTS